MLGRGNTKVGTLSQLEVFSKCSRKELETIASNADELQLPAGYEMTIEGGRGREFFVIADGEASVQVHGREIARLGRGEFFGEMSLVDHGPRTATVVAGTPMTVYVMDVRAFGGAIDVAASLRQSVMARVTERAEALEEAARVAS